MNKQQIPLAYAVAATAYLIEWAEERNKEVLAEKYTKLLELLLSELPMGSSISEYEVVEVTRSLCTLRVFYFEDLHFPARTKTFDMTWRPGWSLVHWDDLGDGVSLYEERLSDLISARLEEQITLQELNKWRTQCALQELSYIG